METKPKGPPNETNTPALQDQTSPSLKTESKMSLLASMMAMPPPHHTYRSDYSWDHRTADHARPSASSHQLSLPSIRQAFPEFDQSALPSESTARPPSSATSPTSSTRGPLTSPVLSTHGLLTSPQYALASSLGKRSRSFDEHTTAESMRPRQVPRLRDSPEGLMESLHSPTPGRPSPPLHAHGGWPTSARAGPYSPAAQTSPVPSSYPTLSVGDRPEYRASLPTLPTLPGAYERRDEYSSAIHRAFDATFPPPPPSYSYASYHGRHMSHPAPTTTPHAGRPYDRSPFTNGSYGPGYQQDMARYRDINGANGGERGNRKRRGNLPKETTDQLRSWFKAHLSHPYPTEDEKQALMKLTGLQMNQISNWFINARRRQLPAMMNDARAEADAMSALSNNSGRTGFPLSDGESTGHEDEYEHRRNTNGLVRGTA